MSESELQSRVEEWLAKTGYPLEMRATRIVRMLHEQDSEWIVLSNLAYADSKNEAVREIDINASYQISSHTSPNAIVQLDLVIECKSTTAPWVILKGSFEGAETKLVDFSGTLGSFNVVNPESIPIASFVQSLSTFLHEKVPSRPAAGYTILEAFKGTTARDSAYSATRQVMAAVEYLANECFAESDFIAAACMIPVVVTTSPLFEAALDSATGQLVTRSVTRSAVSVHCEFRNADVVVVIINEADLIDFCTNLLPMSTHLEQFIAEIDVDLLRLIQEQLDGAAPS